jgi:small subunit ribosomal protein S1
MSNEIKETEEAATATASVKDETILDDSTKAVDEEQSSNEMDFGAILEQFEQEQTHFSSGELVQGKVVGVSERGVLVDFGYKSEGVIGIEEFTGADGEPTVKVGDELEVIIRSMDAGDKPPVLSYTDAIRLRGWAEIEEAFKNETPIIGKVTGKTKGGLRVDLHGIEAFLPGSQADSRPLRNLDHFVGQDIEAKIIKFSRKRNNIVLSRKVLTDEVVNAQKAETLNSLEEGYIVEGKIKSMTEYGAFVDLGGIDGLLHVTDMSWGRLQHPHQLFKVNDSVQAKVLKLDRSKEKVSLGYKQLLPDPWSTVGETYPIGSKTKGKVSSVTDYGAFIELEPGVEGLVHVSEMSWSKRSKHPKNLVEIGEEVEVLVLGIDTHDRRISLGMKQLTPNPWETIRERFEVGSRVRGKVRNITDFGAFVEVEDGVDGLVHVSDISWSKKIKHAKEVLKRGQEVEAVITSIDTEGRRLSLSIKELAPSAWDSFVATHKPGDLVKGKISRFANFGVFVDLGEELEGLCHISELADERVDRPENVVSLGQEMDFKIIRIEADVQKIGLSARAVGREDEPEFDSKVYSTEAKGGMASLAELANLKFGRETEPNKEEVKEEPKAEAVAEETAETVAETVAVETPEAAEEVTEEKTEEVSETSSETAAMVAEVTEETTAEVTAETSEAVEEIAEEVAEAVEEKNEEGAAAESEESETEEE